jgi:hypothetical protein
VISTIGRSLLVTGVVAIALAGAAAASAAITTERVSVSSSGRQNAHFGAYGGVISGDGRLVVFTSRARHLVPGDTSRGQDVFLHNRATGRTLRVSVADDESQANGWSSDPVISADGRFVVFSSEGTNLLRGHTDRNGLIDDVYVRDRLRGRTRLVSRNQSGAQGTGFSLPLDVSGDGRYILFGTNSKNFKPLRGLSQFNGAIYLRDMRRRRTYWIPGSVNNNGVLGGAVSDDGRIVAYTVKSQGVPRRSNVYNRATGRTHHLRCRVISCLVVTVDDLSPSGRNLVLEGHGHVLRANRRSPFNQDIVSTAPHGAAEDGQSTAGRIADRARVVLFVSSSTNLVPGDTNGQPDVFRANVRFGTMTRVDVTSSNAQIPAGVDPSLSGCMADRGSGSFFAFPPAISRDGGVATFATDAPSVVAGDTNGLCDVFVRAGLAG